MFVTDAQLKTFVAAALKKPEADLDLTDYWSTVIPECNIAAYNEIVCKLAARGYTAAQIAAWDRGAEFEKRIGLYWAAVEGGIFDAVDDRMVERLKVYWEWLDSVPITNGGVLQNGHEIGTGPLETSDELFGVPIDPDDTQLGQVLKW